MNIGNNWLFALVCFYFFTSIFTHSRASELDPQNSLNPIVISGARQKQNLSDAVTSISIISKVEIERSGAKSLGDLLKGQNGVEVGQSGGLGSQTSFFLRGTESRNALVFIDGVRVRDSITQSSLAENIPLALVKKIEIVRGNVSALYGDGAVGGVINIFTDMSSDKEINEERVFKKINVEYGSFGTTDLSGTVNTYTKDRLNFSVGFQQIDSDGFSATNPAITGSLDSTDSDDDGYKNIAMNLSIDKSFSDSKIGGKI